MATVRVRYPGRICLLGEHCDWAGGSSLTVPCSMGIEIRAEPAREGVLVRSEMDGEFLEAHFPLDAPIPTHGPLRFVAAAMAELKDAGISIHPAELWVASDLPSGRGLSSSAAFSLGILDALARLSGHEIAALDLVEHAYNVEHRHLDIACGRLDPAACAAAQPLLLRWTADTERTIQMATTRVAPLGTLHLIVGVMNAPRDTQKILSCLNRHHRAPIGDADGDAVREAIVEFGSAAERGAHALRNGHIAALGQAMNDVQKVYESNLSLRFEPLQAPRLTRVVHDLRSRGALGAKFSGAGGDGSVVALFPDENAARSSAIWLEGQGLSSWYAPVAHP